MMPPSAAGDRPVLPLFPLPAVLFPGALVPLYIFEPRYQRLVGDVREADRRFGFLYHDPDEHGPFLNEPGRVGCVAEIRKWEPADEGHSWILVRGLGRFRTEGEALRGRPYYEAEVTPFVDEDSPGIQARRRSSTELVRTAVEIMGETALSADVLNPDEELSFKLAQMVGIHPGWQQALLGLRSEVQRLDRIDSVFQAAIDRATGGPRFP